MYHVDMHILVIQHHLSYTAVCTFFSRVSLKKPQNKEKAKMCHLISPPVLLFYVIFRSEETSERKDKDLESWLSLDGLFNGCGLNYSSFSFTRSSPVFPLCSLC